MEPAGFTRQVFAESRRDGKSPWHHLPPPVPWLALKGGNEVHSFNMYIFTCQADGLVGDALKKGYKPHSSRLSCGSLL